MCCHLLDIPLLQPDVRRKLFSFLPVCISKGIVFIKTQKFVKRFFLSLCFYPIQWRCDNNQYHGKIQTNFINTKYVTWTYEQTKKKKLREKNDKKRRKKTFKSMFSLRDVQKKSWQENSFYKHIKRYCCKIFSTRSKYMFLLTRG